jgi:tRNA modification GTPase
MVEDLMGLPSGRLSGIRRAVGRIGADEVVAISWPSGRSYTGEEMVELVCFGATAATARIMEALAGAGAAPARPGEFTRRAVLSGRMSAVELIALSSVWSGAGRPAELPGDAARLLGSVRLLLEDIEGAIEFGDAQEGGEACALAARAAGLALDAAGLARAAREAEGPLRVTILGPVNAGKSTLFNALLGEDRAMVSGSPGTTRDGISARADIGGEVVELSDSAGSGGGGEFDAEAWDRSVALASRADCLIWLCDAGGRRPPPELAEMGVPILEACGRCDLGRGPGLNVSGLTGEGLEEIGAWISGRRPPKGCAHAAGAVEKELLEAAALLGAGDYAPAAEGAGRASGLLGGLLDEGAGPSAVERVLERLCIGK